MKKRTQLAVLFVMVALMLFSGCSGKDDNDTGNVSDSPPDNISDSPPDNSAAADAYGQYTGVWAQEEIGWLYGGTILDISTEADTMQIAYFETMGAPMSREAEIDVSVPLSDIQDDRLETDFENDGWGNAGTIRITFADDEILCKISDVHYVGEDGAATWGVTETTSVLVRMDNAHELMEYDLEEYYEMFPEENPDNWAEDAPAAVQPSYDTSKASGILANFGLTEEEFRAACVPLQYVGMTFQDIPIYSYESEQLAAMKNYPGQYANGGYRFPHFEVESKNITSDGYPFYYNDSGIYLYDFRDDIYSPTISPGNTIDAYTLFYGVQTTVAGKDVLSFLILSCDK